METLITGIREGIRAGSTDETQLDLLVAKLTNLAASWSHDADEIRPGGGDVDHMLEGYEEVESDAAATTLDECATALLQVVEHPEHVGEDHPDHRPVGEDLLSTTVRFKADAALAKGLVKAWLDDEQVYLIVGAGTPQVSRRPVTLTYVREQ